MVTETLSGPAEVTTCCDPAAVPARTTTTARAKARHQAKSVARYEGGVDDDPAIGRHRHMIEPLVERFLHPRHALVERARIVETAVEPGLDQVARDRLRPGVGQRI